MSQWFKRIRWVWVPAALVYGIGMYEQHGIWGLGISIVSAAILVALAEMRAARRRHDEGSRPPEAPGIRGRHDHR